MVSVKIVREGDAAKAIDALMRAIKERPNSVAVGFPAGQADADIVARAVWNEFGTSRGIPERPAVRNAMREFRDTASALAAAAVREIIAEAVSGSPATATKRRALETIGVAAVGAIQKEITALSDPPNAPSTIRQKGSSNPLINTGQMRQSVSFKIEEN